MENDRTLSTGNNWQQLKEQATMLLKSGFLPPSLKSAEQVIAVVLSGKELGIPMMEAIRGINIIQGKPSVSPQTMLALANRTGQLEDIKIQTGPSGAIVQIKRKGREWHSEAFGPNEARDMGLDTKDNYRKQAPTMFKWRALAAALRVTFPDAISGMYTPDELGAEVQVTETGEMTVETVKEKIAHDEAEYKNSLREASEGAPETLVNGGFKADLWHNPSDMALPVEHETQSHPYSEGGKDVSPDGLIAKMLEWGLAMTDGTPKEAEKLMLSFTEFTSKEDGTQKCANSISHLKKRDAWVRASYGKMKKAWEKWNRNEEVSPLVEEPVMEE